LMKILASPQVSAHVREHGGVLFVWVDRLVTSPDVGYLETSLESPGADRGFVRFSSGGFDLLFDGGGAGLPEELHLVLKGRRTKRVRAYWNGNSFLRASPSARA
jgi:hypothetical protein